MFKHIFGGLSPAGVSSASHDRIPPKSPSVMMTDHDIFNNRLFAKKI